MSSTTSGGGRTRGTVVAAAALVAVVILGLASLTATPGGTPSAPVATPSTSASSATGSVETQMPPELERALLALARRDVDDGSATGRVDAPVVLVEYADFQCPYCGKFARDTKPQLMKYVQDGTLRIEWRNFPIFGDESTAAARAGYAAAQQGRFWEFYNVAFSKERTRNSGAFAPGKLEKMAREAGVPDLDRFRADMKSAAAQVAIDRDSEEGYRIGVTSTPAFLVNAQPILGAQPFEVFEAAIEKARLAAGTPPVASSPGVTGK
ncbi:DsbA family protein [Sphaerimonospora cavernae]|uniref:DsbA family protein n=1 Tax=Sphaerimonospora cavernae TaxID=1740611 RepID=A0ABV6U8P6_9ACTN